MTKTGLAFFLILFSNLTFSQSTADLERINYQSEFEKIAFSNYFQRARHATFDLLMASGNLLTDSKAADAKKRFYTHLEEFKNDKFAARKNDKKVKLLYDNIHKAFLRKFEVEAKFEDIFYNGSYNAVSATALFALACDELKIPFAIKEEPEHVFLIAYPDTDRIKVETTSMNGVLTMNTTFKQHYVKMLKEQKLISAAEASARSTDELFDKYYFGNQQNISIGNLAGIQYMNAAISNNERKQFMDAYWQMDKANLLYPSQRASYLLMVTTTSAFEGRKERDSIHATLLARISEFREFGMTNEVIQTEFARVLNQLLFEKGNREAAKAYFTVLTNHIDNETLTNDLAYINHYETGRLSYNQGKYKEASQHFGAALKLRPHNIEVANTFISCLAQSFSTGTNLEHLNTLEQNAALYPTLRENNIFNNLLATAFLIQSGYEFDQERPIEGEKYRLRFEECIQNHPDIPINSQLIGHAYSRSAIYYFRKGQTARARGIIDTGLKHSPNNFELLSRKQMIR